MLIQYLDDDKSRFDFTSVGSSTDSTIYKLEIMTVELFSIYGKQVRTSLFCPMYWIDTGSECIHDSHKGKLNPCLNDKQEIIFSTFLARLVVLRHYFHSVNICS